MQTGQNIAVDLHSIDRKRLHRIIELALTWFRDQPLETYHPYHDVRGAVIRQIEQEFARPIGDAELLTFDAVLDSLEQLNFGYWCADEEDLDQSDIYTYFYVTRSIDITPSQIQWHFKMQCAVAWLRTYAAQGWVPATFREILQLFSNRLLYCKYEGDYWNFREHYLARAGLNQFLFWAALQIMESLFS